MKKNLEAAYTKTSEIWNMTQKLETITEIATAAYSEEEGRQDLDPDLSLRLIDIVADRIQEIAKTADKVLALLAKEAVKDEDPTPHADNEDVKAIAGFYNQNPTMKMIGNQYITKILSAFPESRRDYIAVKQAYRDQVEKSKADLDVDNLAMSMFCLGSIYGKRLERWEKSGHKTRE